VVLQNAGMSFISLIWCNTQNTLQCVWAAVKTLNIIVVVVIFSNSAGTYKCYNMKRGVWDCVSAALNEVCNLPMHQIKGHLYKFNQRKELCQAVYIKNTVNLLHK
jgi:hypothetical protein